MMKLEDYISLYHQLFENTRDKDVSIAILHELGTNDRSLFINEQKKEAKEERKREPATENQKKFIKSLQEQGQVSSKIDVEKLSKEEASILLNEVTKNLYKDKEY